MEIIKLGISIFGLIVKIVSKSTDTSAVFDSIQDIVGATGDVLENRNNCRTAETIADQIAVSCNDIVEHSRIEENRRPILIECVRKTVEISGLSYVTLIEHNMQVDSVHRLLLAKGEQFEKEFDPSENEIYHRLLRHIASVVIESVKEAPDFANQGISAVINRLATMQECVNRVLQKIEEIERVVVRKDVAIQDFERIYRSKITERFGWIRLLGANSLSRDEKRYKLSVAYVTLEMSRNNDVTEFEVKNLFNDSNTVWIEGDAGSGKTTFLQWVAIEVAANQTDVCPDFYNSIPILVELRAQDCKNLSLKRVVDTLMDGSDYTMPEGWLTHILEKGQAIILVDGIDEVKKSERGIVLDWIDDLREKYKKLRIIITSRPQVEDRVYGEYIDVKILPMTRSKVEVFLDYWHKAVLVDKFSLSAEEANRYKERLLVQIDKYISIRKMVMNPLLCAMICALHYKNGMIISNERNSLYEDCCKMLFDSRDTEKDVPAYKNITLTYEEKKIILAQLSYWMMKNGLVVVDREDALECVNRSLKGLKATAQQQTPDEIFDFLLERSGILRSPEKNKIDFIHKSFQEYLAAYEISKQDDWGLLAEKADDSNWHETLVLFMGFATQRQAKDVLKKVLQKEDDAHLIIAAACALNTPFLPESLRNSISNRLEKIIPPHTVAEGEKIAAAGELVLPFLQYKKDYSKEEVYRCIRTVRLINSPQSLSTAASYLECEVEERVINVIGAMLRSTTEGEIRESGVEKSIFNYLKAVGKQKCLKIPESFLIQLSEAHIEELKKELSPVHDLYVVDYRGEYASTWTNCFGEVITLTVVGEFEELPIINCFRKKLSKLTICDKSRRFDVEQLNKVNGLRVDEFYFYSGKTMYIAGYDLAFLSKAREVGLFLYDSMSEISLDGFSELKGLKGITLFAEFLDELDYRQLIYESNIERVRLQVPEDYDQSAIDYLNREVSDTKKKSIVIKHKYPYGRL